MYEKRKLPSEATFRRCAVIVNVIDMCIISYQLTQSFLQKKRHAIVQTLLLHCVLLVLLELAATLFNTAPMFFKGTATFCQNP